ncbi:uncharacterized protein LDX57_011043 [Aspergillus melleus]|uniref:uncharacterized protein n=1 Tax=Aspergillus melleus TaxID=138277 RepID=UPI001E8E77FF|nr:uncharacterized protein LDX57_011043 [Aspergillus melleus]KAH8433409.1 hypothetical protein LDX57_011043 [Aspergillus melleus]
MIKNVAFPNFDKSSKVSTCSKAAVQKVAGERVQNDVNALTGGCVHDGREERRIARAENV